MVYSYRPTSIYKTLHWLLEKGRGLRCDLRIVVNMHRCIRAMLLARVIKEAAI